MNLEDIAHLSGVSRSTVSRVLNGHPNVSDRTRERVMKVVQLYDFTPNPAARALASQSLHVIGILIPYLVNEIFSDPFFPQLIQGITSTANQARYNVTLWLSSADIDSDTFYTQVFNPRLADGVIVSSAVVDYPMLARLDSMEKPYVLIGRPNVNAESINYVDSDSVTGAYLLVKHMIERGRQRIGMIPGHKELTASQDREQGYRKALEEAGLSFNLVGPAGEFQKQGGYESMQFLLEHGVDGVFAASDMMALGAIQAIRDAGLSIPADVAVGGFDDVSFGSDSNPPLTTVRQPIGELGHRAAQILLDIIRGELMPPYHHTFPVEFIVREST